MHKAPTTPFDSSGQATPRRKALPLFLAMFLPVAGLLAAIVLAFQHQHSRNYLDNLKAQQQSEVVMQTALVDKALESVKQDVRYLSQCSSLIAFLDQPSAQGRATLERDFMAFSRQKGAFDQIRLMDMEGMEIIRVNLDPNGPCLVPDSELQSKGRRYYFRESMVLGQGKIYVSPMDLNMEHGEIERPLKPMLRLGSPVFDSRGKKRGVLLLNYLGARLLDDIRGQRQGFEGIPMLLDHNAYWLLAPDPDLEFAFMFEGREDDRFSVRYPREWTAMATAGQGQIRTDNGLFTFGTVRLLTDRSESSSQGEHPLCDSPHGTLSPDQCFWKYVSHVPVHVLDSHDEAFRSQVLGLGGAMLALSALGTWLLALAVVRRKAFQERLRVMALHDPLTGLPNRTLFFDRMERAVAHAQRAGHGCGLLYIDLDGFKQINDTMGHEAGDELLKIFARQIQGLCRKADSAARMGGDEFTLLLAEVSGPEGAEVVARKILASLAAPLSLAKGDARVGASIGISLFPEDGKDVASLVSMADKAMYDAKSQGKNTFRFAADV